MEEEEEEEAEGGRGGGRRMDGSSETLQTPTSGQFLMPASGFLHVNENTHRHELSLPGEERRKEGKMDGSRGGWRGARLCGYFYQDALCVSEPGCNSLLPSYTFHWHGSE